MEVIGEGVEVTRGRGNFDTLTKQKKRGLDVGKWQKCQCQHLDPDFRQPVNKKNTSYLNVFWRKKMFCVKSMSDLPTLTYCSKTAVFFILNNYFEKLLIIT